jgi:hypothetical protein
VDFVALRQGRLILVECKESGEPLNEPGEASRFAEQLSKLAAVADHLGASRIVNACPTGFPEDKDPFMENISRDSKIRIEWWEGENLLDPYRYALGESSRPEGWPDEYLRLVSRNLLPA